MALKLIFPLALLLICLDAAPAGATLRVESNGTDGLIVVDQNDLGDLVQISTGTSNGDPVYFITSINSLDFFKYDFRQGCAQDGFDSTKAVCNRLFGKINLAMNGGRDDVRVVNSSGISDASVNLGNGDDYYEGIAGADNVFAAGGSDDIRTVGGNDRITFPAGDGEDQARSGPGNDKIDETPGTGLIFGGDDFFDAGPGDDEVILNTTQSGESNEVQAGDGNDTVTVTGSTFEQVNGGRGNDTITTGDRRDQIIGGDGLDTISTGAGQDTIDSKEVTTGAAKDDVRCGFDPDQVFADLKDTVDAINNKGGGTCEEVDRSPVGETPHVVIAGDSLRVGSDGDVNVRLRCPRGVRSLGCEGTLQLRIARTLRNGVQASRSQTVSYSIRAGGRRAVALRLSSGDVQTLRRRRNLRGILVSVERGRKGLKTTIRNPRLALR